MTSLRPLAWRTFPAPASHHTLRRLAAVTLRRSSLLLARLARRLALPPEPSGLPPALEFYADAGAPEGALYLDGQLVGYLPTRRL
jgi:hypothetical protein